MVEPALTKTSTIVFKIFDSLVVALGIYFRKTVEANNYQFASKLEGGSYRIVWDGATVSNHNKA
jgi:hypothetical protein